MDYLYVKTRMKRVIYSCVTERQLINGSTYCLMLITSLKNFKEKMDLLYELKSLTSDKWENL